MHISLNSRDACILAIFFLPIVLPSMAEIGKYPIKIFMPDEYKAGIQNIDFAQNRDMNLFVANNLGILSFNGNEWEVHAYNTGKKQRSLAFDEDTGRLYVGSQGDFGYFENNWDYVSLTDRIPVGLRDFDEVWDVFVYDSKAYFCTFQGIYVYDGDAVSVIRQSGGFNRSFVAGNRLFTQSSKGQLFEIEGRKLSAAIQQGPTTRIVAGLIPRDAGHLIFYNSGQIEYSTQYGAEDVFPALAGILEGKYVNHVLLLSDTRLVISTQRAGLYLVNMQNDNIEHITTDDGLPSNACLRAFQDYTGNLWVGMQNGIALVDINAPLWLINQNIDLQGSGYEAFNTEEGTYYTTSNGIYFLASKAGKSHFLTGTEGPAYGMQMINNKLYAGHHTGLFLLENGEAVRRADTNGLWEVKQLRSNPNYAIAGTYSGLHLFRINDRGDLENVQKIGGFDESSRFFEEDRKGMIWVGQYYRGLYQLMLNQSLAEAVVRKTPDEFDHKIGKHVILSRVDDELYIGSDRGIFRIDQTTDTMVADGLFSGVVGNSWVYLLAQDEQKNVHVFTEDRVGFFKQVSPNNFTYIPSSLFQLRHTFNNDLLKVSKNVRDGVFFNANEGFIHYNPDLESRYIIERRPLVSSVYSLAEDSLLYSRLPFQSRSDSIQPIRIIQGTKVLKFVVESFKFRDVNVGKFRYFLQGLNDDYGDWTNATIKEYTNLEEGNYEFFVQTYNYLGEIVTSIPVQVEVIPPFYKSRTARVIYAVLAILVLYLLYRFQKQYYRSKQSTMEQAKQQELALKQKELQELKEEKIKSELRHVNNLLAASTMNLVVKNEFMVNIKEEIEEVRQNGKAADTEKALERIIKEIDSTLKLQEDWQQFEYHFDQVHGDFLTRLTNEFSDLTPGEQKLCAFLRLKMDTKEIANLMGISLRGVEVARYRLRKKLGLDKHQNLSKFVLEY
jgi:ligand-binding sensor domain-containing protein/DNA-binding CsgD family transcriptional regulator